MRIAQVVTLVSPDGAYGGPLRVAVNQSKSMISLGHEVTIFAGYRGYSKAPTKIQGVSAVLGRAFNILPGSGFAGTFSPIMLLRLLKSLGDFDIVHVHMARDMITLPAAAISRILSLPYVLQMHGMIGPSDRWSAWPLDRLLTKPLIRSAAGIFVLTKEEECSLSRVCGGPLEAHQLTNGVPIVERMETLGVRPREVLFMARLHKVKRPTMFARVACRLARQFPEVVFSIVGPDEGEATRVAEIIEESGLKNVRMEGAVSPENVIDRMSQAYLFVLPSRAEVIPMSVLEAMSVAVPVVVSEPNGLSTWIKNSGAGSVVDQSEERLGIAISDILSDERLHASMSDSSQKLVRKEFSSEAVAREVLRVYESFFE